MYVYSYVYICMYICMYIYVCIYVYQGRVVTFLIGEAIEVLIEDGLFYLLTYLSSILTLLKIESSIVITVKCVSLS